MRISWRWKWHDLAMLLALTACDPVTLTESAAPVEKISCRDYGSAAEARRIAEKWIAGHKSQYEEVIGGVSWANFPWSIGFSLLSGDKQSYATVTLLPNGDIARCETIEECGIAPMPEKSECPASQGRIMTELQAIKIGTRFLEKQGIRIDRDKPPAVYGQPVWWVFVEEQPLMPGGHYTLLISADGDVIDTIPGE